MRTYQMLPLALTLLATSLPALSAQVPSNPRLSYENHLAIFDYQNKDISPSSISGSDISNLFSAVNEINTQQEKDKSTIADLTSKVRDLENQNKDLKRSQDDLSRKLDDLSRKIK